MEHISLRIPERLARMLARRKGNRSAVIVEALTRYLDGAPIEKQLLEKMDALGITLEEIKRELARKEQSV